MRAELRSGVGSCFLVDNRTLGSGTFVAMTASVLVSVLIGFWVFENPPISLSVTTIVDSSSLELPPSCTGREGGKE